MNVIKKYLKRKYASDFDFESKEKLMKMYEENPSEAIEEVLHGKLSSNNIIVTDINDYIDWYMDDIKDVADNEGKSVDEVIDEIKNKAEGGKFFFAPAGSVHDSVPANDVQSVRTFEELIDIVCDANSVYNKF